MADIRFSDLLPLSASTISDEDLFAVADTGETASKSIRFDQLKAAIVDANFFAGNTISIITAINQSPAPNNLKASELYFASTTDIQNAGGPALSGYKSGAYYLNYENFYNTPAEVKNLSDLYNNDKYVQLEEGTAQYPNGRLVLNERVYTNNNGIISISDPAPYTVDTTLVPEGNNLYYTNNRVTEYFDNNFGSYYNQYTAAFDNGLIRDSLLDTPATFINEVSNQSDTVVINDASLADNYQVNQTLRVYGASIDSTVDNMDTYESNGFTFNIATPAGFVTSGQKEGTALVDFSYKVALFDTKSGKITRSATAVKSVSIGIPPESNANTVYDQFNTDHFIRLTFESVPTGKGILIYRSQGTDSTYKLTAVLGPKEVTQNSWIDYFTFDYTPWSGKNGKFTPAGSQTTQLDNTYDEVIHFPITAPTAALYGWDDVNILSATVNESANTITLKLSTSLNVNQIPNCTLCHNDTSKIQTAINANSAIGRKNILLNAKTYISAVIELPDKFGLEGTTAVTKIIKLPWSGAETGVNNGKLIRTQSVQEATTLTFVGIDIDGNMTNQFLFPDTSDPKANYAIDLGINSNDITFDRVRLFNVSAGGVWVPGVTNLKITTCDFLNSGISDRYAYSPLVADAAFTSLITGCRFENYTDNVNVSLTDKGVVANNIINNCGTGLFIYGSRFFVSSPNVLVGPANEFLPTPDILSSEYDLINIDLTEAYLSSDVYRSDDFRYAENGQPYNLLFTEEPGYNANNPLNSTQTGTVYYNTFAVKKSVETGVEEYYDSGVDPITINNSSTDPELLEGVFKFQIPYADVESIKKAPFIIDARESLDLTFIVDDGSGRGVIRSTQHDLRAFKAGDTVVVAQAGTNNGEFIVAVDGTLVDVAEPGVDYFELVMTTQFASADTNAGALLFQKGVGDRSFTAMRARNPEHVGWAWSASYEQRVKSGEISGVTGWLQNGLDNATGEFDYDLNQVSLKDAVYQITVENLGNIAPNRLSGTEITFSGTHTGWGNTQGVTTGTVISVVSQGTQFVVKIKFVDTNPTGTAQSLLDLIQAGDLVNGLPTGQINIFDKFVLAQGRIL